MTNRPQKIPALAPLVDALAYLKQATGRHWSRNEFLDAVVKLNLPMRAATPNDARAVLPSLGGYVDAALAPLGRRRLAILLTPQIHDLLVHGQCQTRLVALEPADADFMPWAAIKARRQVLARAALSPEDWNKKWPDSDWHAGEFMGESDLARFELPVQVTDETCRVPSETIEELIAAQGPNTSEDRQVPINPPAPAPTKVIHALRRNSLDVVIDKAIQAAGASDTHSVFLALRELALDEVPPLAGVDAKGIRFTDDNNQSRVLTRDALRKRLQKRSVGNGS